MGLNCCVISVQMVSLFDHQIGLLASFRMFESVSIFSDFSKNMFYALKIFPLEKRAQKKPNYENTYLDHGI